MSGRVAKFKGIPPGGHPLALAVLVVFSVAMAYMEAAIVFYLRQLYYPDGFVFPLAVVEGKILLIEIGRELCTLVFLAAIGWFAGRRLAERFAMFCLAFALWDIFYYVWLKVMLGWPESFFTWDILFLIPLPWIGPVLSPVLVSLSLIAGSVAIMLRLSEGGMFRPNVREWIIAVGGAWLILLSYMLDTDATMGGQMPSPYRWELLIAGIAAGFYALMRSMFRTSVKGEEISDE
jgi:hypothetical protein